MVPGKRARHGQQRRAPLQLFRHVRRAAAHTGAAGIGNDHQKHAAYLRCGRRCFGNLIFDFRKEKPPTPPCPEELAGRSDFKEGIKFALKRKILFWHY